MARPISLLRSVFLGVVLTTGCNCDGDTGGPSARDGSSGDGANLDGSGGDLDGSGGDGANLDGGGGDGAAHVPPDVHVVITSDNAYGFGYGSAAALSTYFNGIEDNGNDIFLCSAACDENTPCMIGTCDHAGTCNEDRRGPETYVVPGTTAQFGDYLYVVTWSDDSVTQGLIGQFAAADGSKVVRTGDDGWTVCATGVDYDIPGPDPSKAVIDEWIGRCNAGEGLSSGWVGETPNAQDQALRVLEPPLVEPGQFAPLCRKPASTAGDAIEAEARWIWFDDDVTDGQSPFVSDGTPRGEFLIFRLPIGLVIVIE